DGAHVANAGAAAGPETDRHAWNHQPRLSQYDERDSVIRHADADHGLVFGRKKAGHDRVAVDGSAYRPAGRTRQIRRRRNVLCDLAVNDMDPDGSAVSVRQSGFGTDPDGVSRVAALRSGYSCYWPFHLDFNREPDH